MKIGTLLKSVRGSKYNLFVKWFGQYVKAYRKIVLGESAGDRHCRKAGKISGYREYIRKIHAKWVFRLLPYLKGRRRRSRRHYAVANLKRVIKILFYLRPDFLSLEIIRVVVTGRKAI